MPRTSLVILSGYSCSAHFLPHVNNQSSTLSSSRSKPSTAEGFLLIYSATIMDIGNLPPLNTTERIICLGIEGSANKVGVGIVLYEHGTYSILANPRKTYITPAGQGFLPRETAWHHQVHIVALVRCALLEAKLEPSEIDVICFTKGASPTDEAHLISLRCTLSPPLIE